MLWDFITKFCMISDVFDWDIIRNETVEEKL